MDEIFEAYLAAQRRRRSSPLTLKAVAHALRSTQRWLDAERIEAGELTLLDCERYFDELLDEHAISTVRRKLAYVRAAYGYALRHELIGHDPTGDVKLPRLPDLEPATYANEQLRVIHAAIRSDRDETAFFLLAFAGLRLGELASLTWGNVDLVHWQLRLVGKGGKFRLVPLHPVLQDHLRERRPAAADGGAAVIHTGRRRPYASRTLGGHIRQLVNRAGVETEQPSHAFRRTVATVMYEQGVRTRVIERIMGWAPRQMHERHYLRVASEQMHAAILTLYRDDPICDRQARALQLRTVEADEAQPAGWLERETAQLDALERRLDASV